MKTETHQTVDDPSPRSPGGPAAQGMPPEPPRRRLVRGGAAGVGVFFALQARTALGGGICQSPSAMISGNTSPRPGDGSQCSGGRSPGFWKVPKHASYWPAAGATFPKFAKPISECGTGMQNLTLANIDSSSPGTLVSQVLPGAGVPAGTGIWAVMAFPNSFSGGQLMRHLIAAWLNAGYFRSSAEKYALTKQQVVDMWNAVKGGGEYCPSSLKSCGEKGMNAAAVVRYIEGMYDLNSAVEPDLCKGQ